MKWMNGIWTTGTVKDEIAQIAKHIQRIHQNHSIGSEAQPISVENTTSIEFGVAIICLKLEFLSISHIFPRILFAKEMKFHRNGNDDCLFPTFVLAFWLNGYKSYRIALQGGLRNMHAVIVIFFAMTAWVASFLGYILGQSASYFTNCIVQCYKVAEQRWDSCRKLFKIGNYIAWNTLYAPKYPKKSSEHNKTKRRVYWYSI